MSDPYAVLLPRRGRYVAAAFGVGSLVVFTGLALALPAVDVGWGLTDSLLMVGFGVLVAVTMWRFATLRAAPSRSGLVVRNILVTTTVRWDEVERVRFAGGDPWVVLDLVSGEQLAVMAVQKADGAFGRAGASRLAALVQAGNDPDRT